MDNLKSVILYQGRVSNPDYSILNEMIQTDISVIVKINEDKTVEIVEVFHNNYALIERAYINRLNKDPSKLLSSYLGTDSVLVECATIAPGL